METHQQANNVLTDLYQFIDETFTDYIISLPTPKLWKSHVKDYRDNYTKTMRETGMVDMEIDRRIEQQSHIFEDGEFKIQITTAQLNRNLEPG